MEKLIIKIKYGGLGDHLFYSHIPRIAKESGKYSEVFISNKSDFRNEELKDLIWKNNPYVDGFSDADGTNIETITIDAGEEANLLDKIMLGFGLDDSKRFHDPEIYYKPKLIPELSGKTLYDPNYISNAGFGIGFKIKNFFKKNPTHIDYQMVIRKGHSIPIFNFKEFLQCESIFDFIDTLYSVENIYCLATGTATLASAIGKKAHVFYTDNINPIFRHSKLNDYIKLG